MEVDEEMDEEELAEWRTIFNLFDVDGDESITGEVKVHHLKIIPIRNLTQGCESRRQTFSSISRPRFREI